MPLWLVTVARTAASSGPRRDGATWRHLVCDGASEGARNQSIAQLSGHLLRRYVDPVVTLKLMQAFNTAKFNPPLPDEEVTKTVASIARKELRRREARDGGR
jgi:Primase C terminal 1 (PriCT-1)